MQHLKKLHQDRDQLKKLYDDLDLAMLDTLISRLRTHLDAGELAEASEYYQLVDEMAASSPKVRMELMRPAAKALRRRFASTSLAAGVGDAKQTTS